MLNGEFVQVTDADVKGAAPVVVINETMARFLFPKENAIGRCIVLRELDDLADLAVEGTTKHPIGLFDPRRPAPWPRLAAVASMEILVLALLIILNGCFAMSEIAMIASRPFRLEQMAAKGSRCGAPRARTGGTSGPPDARPARRRGSTRSS